MHKKINVTALILYFKLNNFNYFIFIMIEKLGCSVNKNDLNFTVFISASTQQKHRLIIKNECNNIKNFCHVKQKLFKKRILFKLKLFVD